MQRFYVSVRDRKKGDASGISGSAATLSSVQYSEHRNLISFVSWVDMDMVLAFYFQSGAGRLEESHFV